MSTANPLRLDRQPRATLRGVTVTAPPAAWGPADPDDVMDYGLLPGSLNPDPLDACVTVEVAAEPAGLSVSAPAPDGHGARFLATGGVHGVDYAISYRLAFASGRVLHGGAVLPVRVRGVPVHAAPALSYDDAVLMFDGAVLTFR